MRLDKFLAHCTQMSRKAVKEHIKKGDVTINDKICKKNDENISDNDSVLLCGDKISYIKEIYIMLNKPKGIVCATTDKNDTTVIDLIANEHRVKGMFPAGRLDKDSTGFVLITNNGAFAHDVLAPKKHVSKTYEVQLDAPVTKDVVKAFENGVTLTSGEKMKPAQLFVSEDDSTKATVKITQGVFHQVKRMFGVYNIGVDNLHRTAIGGLELDKNLDIGEYRLIKGDELQKVKERGEM